MMASWRKKVHLYSGVGGGVCCVVRVVELNKRFNSSVSRSGVPISDEAIVLTGSGLTRVSGELSSGGTCGGTGMG